MRTQTITITGLLLSLASASPVRPFPTAVNSDGDKFKFPLSNGFPEPANVTTIYESAGGTLPNAAGPPNVTDTTLAVLRLIAFNEITEVAFFTELLTNITDNVPGYAIRPGYDREYILAALTAIQAQEQLHALFANSALTTYDTANITGAIQPCEYNFPASNLDEAILLANTFTDLVLGTLQDAQGAFASDGDIALIPGIGAVIGNEGEQNGFFRFLEGRRPSAQPFLTRSAGPFAWSALNQLFVVPGSCAQNITTFGLGTPLSALNVITSPILAGDQYLSFQAQGADVGEFQVVYISGQNVPVAQPLVGVVNGTDGSVTFEAFFPQRSEVMDGLTIAVLTPVMNVTAATVDEIAAAALFGPGLIEVF